MNRKVKSYNNENYCMRICYFLQKILAMNSSSIECTDLCLESRCHEVESRTLWECIREVRSDYLELARMPTHPEVEFPSELRDQVYEPLLIVSIFSCYLFSCFLYLTREMDDACGYISDILYSDRRVSIVHIHI
jgi:hypothetical protein